MCWTSVVLIRGKQLKDYVGKNDKTKIVIKLAIIGAGEAQHKVILVFYYHPNMPGPPVREPGMNEEERKHLMLMEHRRREEIKRLMQDGDENYLNQVEIALLVLNDPINNVAGLG